MFMCNGYNMLGGLLSVIDKNKSTHVYDGCGFDDVVFDDVVILPLLCNVFVILAYLSL